jgi:hypothetical protein
LIGEASEAQEINARKLRTLQRKKQMVRKHELWTEEGKERERQSRERTESRERAEISNGKREEREKGRER